MRNRSRDAYRTLVGVLGRDVDGLAEVERQNIQAMQRLTVGEPSWMEYVVVAFTLHNAYSIMESYFLRVAKFFENEVGESSWHRDLLQRMTVAIQGVRPALLEPDDADHLDELRGFRHLYRNLYDRRIDPQRLLQVQGRLAESLGRFRRAHQRFTAKLDQIASKLED